MRAARRHILLGLASALALTAADASAANRLSTARAGRPGSGGGGGGFTITDAAGSPPSWVANYLPTYRDAFVAMSPLVAAGEEAIDVQAVIGTPFSPLATSISFSGAGAAWFDKAPGGKLIFKAATRSSVPRDGFLSVTVTASNGNGISEVATLLVWVPADADCRFVSFDKGSDAASGTSPSTPWKHCPGTTDWTGSAITLTSKTVFFEGVDRGAKHATALIQSSILDTSPPHNGTSSKQHRYAFTGWGGQAKFTGADDIPGSWAAASSSDTYSSPATGVEKITIATAGENFNIVSFGESQGYMAQYPRPNVLSQTENYLAAVGNTNNYDDTAGTSDGGMKRLVYTTNSGDTTPVRFYKPASGDCYIQDAKLAARFNNVDVAYNAAGIGVWVVINVSGNNTSIVPATQFDATNSRVYFANVTPNSSGGYTAYSLLGSPYDVAVAGQYAFSANGLTVIAKRPNTNQAVIARRAMGMGVGRQPYVTYHQAWFERYCGGTTRAGASVTGGIAAYGYNGTAKPGIQIYGLRSHQMYSGNENANLMDVPSGTNGGFVDFIFDRFHQTECPKGAGTKLIDKMLGIQSGSAADGGATAAEIMAYGLAKMRWWFFADDAASRSLMSWWYVRGCEVIEPVVGRFVTVHGDGLPWYRDVAGTFSDHNVVREFFMKAGERWRTMSASSGPDLTIPQYNTFLRGILLAYYGGNYGIQLYDGDPGALYQQCIFTTDPSDTSGTVCFYGGGGFANMTLKNCVTNGVRMSALPDGSYAATWTLDSCYFTGDSYLDGGSAQSLLTDDAVNNRRVLSCTRGTTAMTWDGQSVPSNWLTTLRMGASAGATKLGPFHYV